MSKYIPPEQSRAMQFIDIIFLLVAIFVALWLPLELGLAGAAKEIDKIDNPDLGVAAADARPGRPVGEARIRRREGA